MTCGACTLPEHLRPKEGETQCTDLSDTCIHAKDLCEKPGYRENMENLCPKTCGFPCKKISDMMNEIGYVATTTTVAPVTTMATPIKTEMPVGIPGQSPDPNCKDQHDSCASMTLLCTRPTYQKKLSKLCPLTCKVCTPSTQVSDIPMKIEAVESSENNDSGECVDLGPGCKTLEYLCTDPASQALMSENCPKTCNMCDGGTPPPVAFVCEDKMEDNKCSNYASFCGKSPGLKKLCPKTCNACDEFEASTTQASTTTTTAYERTTQIATTTEAPVVVEEDDSCKDTSDNCPVEWCTMPGPKKVAHTRQHCKKTCNLCKTGESSVKADDCKDKKPNACQNYYKNRCNSAQFKDFVTENCQKTCNLCGKTQSQPASDSSSSSSSSTCVDKKPKVCKSYGKARCNKPAYKKIMKTNCQKTCGLCGSDISSSTQTQSTDESTCKDSLPAKCRQYGAKRCQAKAYKNFMKQKCKKTCGYCGSGSDTGSAPVQPASPQTSASSECKDTKPKYCKSLTKKRCNTAKYKASMAVNCKATCGKCGKYR